MSDTAFSPQLMRSTNTANDTTQSPLKHEHSLKQIQETFDDWSGHGFNQRLHHNFSDVCDIEWQNSKFISEGGSGSVIATYIKVKDKPPVNIAVKSLKLNDEEMDTQLSEINLMRLMRHNHLVEIYGSYRYLNKLSILLYPRAPSDLECVIRHMRTLQQHLSGSREPASTYLNMPMRILSTKDALTWRKANELTKAMCLSDLGESDRTLHDVMKRIFPRLFAIFGCLTEAVRYIHSQKIHHKDIKPANVLVCSRDQGGIRLADFGLSKVREGPLSVVTNPRGTFEYMSLEQSTRGERYGLPADIFSLGCVFLEIVIASYTNLIFIREEFPDLQTVVNLEKESHARFIKGYQDQPWKRWEWLSETLLENEKSHIVRIEILGLVHLMVQRNPDNRPTAKEVLTNLGVLEQVRKYNDEENVDSSPLFGSCCVDPVMKKGAYLLSKSIFGTNRGEKVSLKRGFQSSANDANPDNSPEVLPKRPKQHVIRRNAQGLRIDEPLGPKFTSPDRRLQEIRRVEKMRLCMGHYLPGNHKSCNGKLHCHFSHALDVNDPDIEILRLVPRSNRCKSGLRCTNSSCAFGHNCPSAFFFPYTFENWIKNGTTTTACIYKGPAGKGTCKFSNEEHDLDLTYISPPLSAESLDCFDS